MPSLDFYATDGDRALVLDHTFRLGFRVFEADGQPGQDVREFGQPEDVLADSPGGSSQHLMLFADGSGPGPTFDPVGLKASGDSPASTRFACSGWGLVQLLFGGVYKARELRWSHTNHNTPRRAAKWAGAYPRLGSPDLWDWNEVRQASSRLNRAIRSMAVDTIGPHPVLPAASRVIDALGLAHEYGRGLHREPLTGPQTEASMTN